HILVRTEDEIRATAATIAGMLAGRRRLDAQGWEIKDVYRNTTRPGMPEDETMTSYEDRVIACAEIVILGQGGERVLVDGEPGYRIRSEKLGYVPASSSASHSLPCEAVDDLPQLEAAGAARDQWARAAYRALCCGQADRMAEDHPELWSQAIDALGSYPELLHDVRTAPQPHGAELQNALRRWLPAEPTGP
ncbi:MAG TPA: hypothetical protein PKC18_10175, partial [Lacipirellulaceae bacterium]|nr:hypothetical protein [Lacipirellulaceae bacterium]